MTLLSSIRQIYSPIQPVARQNTEISYLEFLPDDELLPFIYCYWELKTAKALTAPYLYRVVADGCIDIFFELDNPGASYVMGFCNRYTEFQLDNRFHYIGVRFLPTMFPQIFKVPASELSNRAEPLDAVAGNTSSFIAHHFSKGHTPAEIKKIFDPYFKDLLSGVTMNVDKRIYWAIALILKNFGSLHVEKDLDTGVSPRQLRRLFEYYVGDTPKSFSKVVRFQSILSAKPSRQALRQNKLFFDRGYYDQAHFIKEFKDLYGVTPGKAFGR